ncbi:uncharacterized protein LOC121635672 [Melanotaenia boesemani]|uniref:uncharacterized protein LOC121635672 n=1 Tax=Melanotaenia boesemani TaxID=1250792 RepID=UPI001C053E13|nr:uncharacterized protein LOC121635672 [Melanotaenia boesemani]
MKSQKLSFLSYLLFKWQSQATFIGRSVLPVFLLIRLVTVGAAAQTAWHGDDSDFVCNTQSQGCNLGCLDKLMPVSPMRLWTLQLLLVLAPGLVFLLHLIHLINQENQVRIGGVKVKAHIRRAYLACMASVILVEVGSVLVQFLLYGFQIETRHRCESKPCFHTTDCVVPRAPEKSVFLVTVFAASCISILLCVLEVVYVLWCKPSQEDGAEALQSEPEVEESQSFPVQLLALWNSCAGFLGKTILPVLQLIRLIIVGAAVKPVWDNELKHFVCESMQPGCSQAAFNTIFPFSLYQYWTLQVTLVLAPGLIFFSYLVHLVVTAKKDRAEVEVKGHAGLLRAYVGSLSAVILLEVGFAVGQALVFQRPLSITNFVKAIPCPTTTECHLPKPTEKSVFMAIVLFVSCLSGLLNLVEMGLVLKGWRVEKRQQTNYGGFQMASLVKTEADVKEKDADAKLNI